MAPLTSSSGATGDLALAMPSLGPFAQSILALTVTYWPWFTIVVAAETR
jgi:hypothetical protein